jgi:hypothetical protein
MAYLDLSAQNVVPSLFSPVLLYSFPRGLSNFERTAVMMAKIDRPASIGKSGYIARLRRTLFGVRQPNKFASLRLERLRRFSIAVAYGRAALIQRENIRLRALGFSEFQIGEAASIAAHFRRPPSWIMKIETSARIFFQQSSLFSVSQR